MFRPIVLGSVLRSYRGSSGSVLVIGNDEFYVVKCPNNPQGAKVLANELIGSQILKAIGLPTPAWRFATYEGRWSCPWVEDRPGEANSPRCNLHFASKFQRPSSQGTVEAFVPGSSLSRIRNRAQFVGALVFDIWAGSTDVRQALYVEKPSTRTFHATFIDNGHLFGGPQWQFEKRLGTSGCSDLRVYDTPELPIRAQYWIDRIQKIVPLVLPAIIQSVPYEWHLGEIQGLYKHLLARLGGLDQRVRKELILLDHRLGRMRVKSSPARDTVLAINQPASVAAGTVNSRAVAISRVRAVISL